MTALLQRLRQYRGEQWETTECFNGLRDEAADEIERLRREVMRLWGALLRIRDNEDTVAACREIAAFATREGEVLRMERDAP